MTPLPLDLIAGPETAAAHIRTRVHHLVHDDCIPETNADDLPAAYLYIAARHGADVLAEDEAGHREWLGVSVLDAYHLDTWNTRA